MRTEFDFLKFYVAVTWDQFVQHKLVRKKKREKERDKKDRKRRGRRFQRRRCLVVVVVLASRWLRRLLDWTLPLPCPRVEWLSPGGSLAR